MKKEFFYDYYLSKMKESPTDLIYYRYGQQLISNIGAKIKQDEYVVFTVKNSILDCDEIKGFRVEKWISTKNEEEVTKYNYIDIKPKIIIYYKGQLYVNDFKQVSGSTWYKNQFKNITLRCDKKNWRWFLLIEEMFNNSKYEIKK